MGTLVLQAGYCSSIYFIIITGMWPCVKRFVGYITANSFLYKN